MMQKRKSYLSLLLASFLLLFTYSFATAQTYEISFEGGIDGKDVPRCVTADQSVYVQSDEPLGAFEVIFEVGGDFDSYSFTPAALPFSHFYANNGNVVRFAGFLGDNPDDECLDASGGPTLIGTLHFETSDIPNPCEGAITVVSKTVDDPFTHGSLFVLNCCDDPVEQVPDFIPGLLNIVNQDPELTYCPDPITIHWSQVLEFDVTAIDYDTPSCENLTYTISGDTPEAGDAIIDQTGHVTWTLGFDDVCDHVLTIRVTDKCGAYDECLVNVCVYNDPPLFTDNFTAGAYNNQNGDELLEPLGDFVVPDVVYSTWNVFLGITMEVDDQDGNPHYFSVLDCEHVGVPGELEGYTFNIVDDLIIWQIGAGDSYSGDFIITLKVTDNGNTCDPCSPINSDVIEVKVHLVGYLAGIDSIWESDESTGGVIPGTDVEVPIRLIGTPDWKGPFVDPIGGFDLLISYDASALTPKTVERGDAIDTEFEYFVYRYVDNCGGSCPSGLLRIVGLRETNDGVENLEHVTLPGELAVITFYVTTDLTFECQFVPIRFYWLDCGDNTLSDESGDVLFVADDVFDWDFSVLTDDEEFGITGPMDLPDGECYIQSVAENAKTQPLAALWFFNGGIKITCIDEIDARGDINLNGIPYEVADAVVFTNYFVQGMSAFTVVPNDGQVTATDINADGTALSVADLVYLIRIIVGDALPHVYPKLTPAELINVGFNGDIVNLKGTDIGAALFVFDREIIPTLADNANNMTIKYGYINGRTQVLVYNMEHGALSSGNVLNIEGEANLVGVEAADYFGTPLKVDIAAVPTEFALLQNYPNPFNPETVIGLALPVASDWNLAIYNVSGQLVKEFAGYSEAGTIQITWDATNVASGIYFYKATTDQFSATKKMVLLK